MNFYRVAADLEEQGKPSVLCSIVHSEGSTPRRVGSKMIVFPDGKILGTVGGGEIESRVISEAISALENKTSKKLTYSLVDPSRGDVGVCGGTVEVYLEPILPKPVCMVIGGGHVGKAVVHLAKWLGFYVVVSDDRPEFCNPENVPEADRYIPCDMKDLPSQYNIHESCYLILTTRGSAVDVEGLPALMQSKAGFIGIIGSRRRWVLTRKTLLSQGYNEGDLNRIHSPLGLEINAETPEEIAVSIIAELLMIRDGGSGKSMIYHPPSKV